jgi:hypothetical protein
VSDIDQTRFAELPVAIVGGGENIPVQNYEAEPNFGWRRVVAGTMLAGFLTLGLGSDAEATTTDATTADTMAQSSSQESVMGLGDWLTAGSVAIAGVSLLIAERSLRSQRQDKQKDRFIDALQRVAGESDAEKRQAQLNVLAIYAEDPQHAPKVFRTAVEYLKARRSALEYTRSEIEIESIEAGNADAASQAPLNVLQLLDKAMKPRRNADREMVKLFIKTLSSARKNAKQARGSLVGRTIKRALGITQENKLETLREITNLSPAREEGLVNAEGMNLDLLRDAMVDCDVSGTNFNGAGMQADNFTSVVFAGCSLQQAQLEGATLLGCDLSGTDIRAAHFSGDPEDPYFMGRTAFINCVIDEDTKLGRLPDDHPEARQNSNSPNEPDAYRGGGELILKDLKVKPNTLSEEEKIALIHAWQRDGGLKLSADSDPAYIYRPHISRRS